MISMLAPNAFEQLANHQMAAAVKARHRASERRLAKLVVQSEADAPMVATAQQKEQQEKATLLRNWRRWHRDQSDIVLSSRYATDYRDLLQLLDSLIPESAPALVEYIKRCRWLKDADRDTRRTVLARIDSTIVTLRMRHALSPFDDSLPGEEPTAFEKIRYELTGVGAPC